MLYTGKNLRLVLMSLAPGEEIGEETHGDRDQFFRVEMGRGEIWIDGRRTKIESDFAKLVPAGARHDLRHTGDEPLRLCTIYRTPEHADGTVQVTRAEALASREHFARRTTESPRPPRRWKTNSDRPGHGRRRDGALPCLSR